MSRVDERAKLASALEIVRQVLLGDGLVPGTFDTLDHAARVTPEEKQRARRLLGLDHEVPSVKNSMACLDLGIAINDLREPTAAQTARKELVQTWKKTGAAEFAARMRAALKAEGVPIRQPKNVRDSYTADGIVCAFVVHTKGQYSRADRVTVTVWGKKAALFLAKLLKDERVLYEREPLWRNQDDRKAVADAVGLKAEDTG